MSPASVHACPACLRRTWLLGRLTGHLDPVRSQIDEVLALADAELVASVGGRHRAAIEAALCAFDAGTRREQLQAAAINALCRCDPGYPSELLELSAPPAVLHWIGHAVQAPTEPAEPRVAVIGSRAASPYGIQVARSLARGLAAAGLTVVSGMALGIDAAAHEGALVAGGRTLAVLPASPVHPYPVSARALHRRILGHGVVLSELGGGGEVRRWMFPARNRIIAALAEMTVVIEAGARSGALLTAAAAARLGRKVGAVPGRITSLQSHGSHALLAGGARIVRGPEDVLDAIFDRTVRPQPARIRPELDERRRALLRALTAGQGIEAALERAGLSAGEGLAAIGWLELAGYIRREPGGAFTTPP